MKPLASYDLVNAMLIYEPETGVLRWRVTRWRHKAGSLAGSRDSRGYWYVTLRPYRSMPVHRVAWLLTRGAWPLGDIDHINGDPSDNRIANLRDVRHQVNNQNKKRPHKTNGSGYLGVSPSDGGRWRAGIWVSGKNIHLGCFSTPEDAYNAYVTAKRNLHEGCTL